MEKVEVPFLTYTAVPYRVFVLPDNRAVAAICHKIVADSNYRVDLVTEVRRYMISEE